MEGFTDCDYSDEDALGWGLASIEENVRLECEPEGFLQASGQAVVGGKGFRPMNSVKLGLLISLHTYSFSNWMIHTTSTDSNLMSTHLCFASAETEVVAGQISVQMIVAIAGPHLCPALKWIYCRPSIPSPLLGSW